MRLGSTLQLMCTCLIVLLVGVLPATATRNILLLFDERLEFPGLAAIDADIVRTVSSEGKEPISSEAKEPIEIYRETMDLSRFGSDRYDMLLRDYLRAKYADKTIDVAVAVMWPALDFLLTHRDTIFPGTPIVFGGIDRAQIGDRQLPPDVRGIVVKREFAPTLELALNLHPRTERVVVLAGTSEFETQLLDEARKQFRPYEGRLIFTYLTMLPLQELLTALSRLPPTTIVLYIPIYRDGAGEPFIPHEVLERISAAASVPAYGFLDQYLGHGIVGGNLYSFAAHGSAMADLVLRVLANPKLAGHSFSEVSTSKLLFDWRQMRRWGINESSLPAGSEVHFRDQTAWDRYWTQIVVVTTALLAQAALISWLLYERRWRRIAEIATRQTMSDLAHVNRVATANELSASIAHEVNQPLAGIVSNANAGMRWLTRSPPDLGKVQSAFKQIVDAGHHAGDVIAGVRALFRKGAEERDRVDVNEIILNAITLERGDIGKDQVSLRLELKEGLPVVFCVRVQLLQVILNLVRNAIEAMHSAGVRTLRIRSELDGSGDVLVSVEDSGAGIGQQNLDCIFDPFFTTKPHGLGIGLSICRSIIEGHNGHLWAISTVGQGSTFFIKLPRYKAADGWSLVGGPP
jgi:signal transduction histidine kinase